MSRSPTPTSFFALVVVRRGQRFLMVQEQRYGSSWSIPGGRVEVGEPLLHAAIREVLEESGVPVTIEGILRVEHAPANNGARVRVIFVGSPLDDTPPKSVADSESLQAAWLTLEEIRTRPLRGSDLMGFLEQVASGRQVYPLDLLGGELSI
ncbi:MAG TPA: NUDIX domain-containing protein [Kofleriaceae bacterium]|nr:NUDIX domain-containing protein [Kofleriaceae bacterium]